MNTKKESRQRATGGQGDETSAGAVSSCSHSTTPHAASQGLADRLQLLASFFVTPDPGASAPDPATLGDAMAWGDFAQTVALLQAGAAPGDLLPMVPATLRADLWRADPDGRPAKTPTATWQDMASILGPIVWDWPGWLTRAMLTLLVGQSEMGKSILALRIAACYLRGDPWPDGSPFAGTKGRVLWCEAEAGQAINLDRAKNWGLPLGDILCPFMDPLIDVLLEDLQHQARLTAMVTSPDIALMVVDSLSGANRRDENSPEMLGVVKWLAELAKIAGKPVLLTHHLRKRGMLDGGGMTLDRVRGSSTIVQTPRIVWAVDKPDPTQADQIRLAVLKSNLGRKPEPLGMTIGDKGPLFSAKAPENPREETQADKAGDLLLALLAKGPVKAADVEAEMEGAGLSYRTAKRAKDSLGIVSIKKAGAWWWGLPTKTGDIPI